MTEHNIVDFRIMINKSIKLNLHDRAISGYELFDISKKLSENMNIVNNSVLTDLAVNNIKQQSLSLGIKQSHVKRNLLLHDEDPCLTFTVGDPDAKILYSPGYPGHYPKKANCVVILEGLYVSVYISISHIVLTIQILQWSRFYYVKYSH